MWPFGKKTAEKEAEGTAERLDDLEDAIAHLQRRFARLQQQVTRWSRDFDEEDDAEDGDEFTELLEQKRRSRE